MRSFRPLLAVGAVVSVTVGTTLIGGAPAGAGGVPAVRAAQRVGPSGTAVGARAPMPGGWHPSAVSARPSALSTAPPAGANLRPARNGTVRVEASGSTTAITERVRALGGRVLAATPGTATSGTASVVLPASRVGELARTAGVNDVRPLLRPVPDATSPAPGPSQAVAASGAQSWIGGGTTGAGQKVAIVDIGFGTSQSEYQSELSAGHLGASTQLVNEDCTDQSNSPTPYDEAHGLAVAELAQQQAPDAQLYLYCVNSRAAVANAELAIEQAGIKIVSSSLSWFEDARGDGTGPSGSVAATVARARQHGILWFESTGNYVPDHWGGTMTDVGRDHILDMGNNTTSKYPYESDFFYTAPSSGAPTSLSFVFQWDQWPASAQVRLEAAGVQCFADIGSVPNTLDGCDGQWLTSSSAPLQATSSGSVPAISLSTAAYSNSSPYPQVWEVWVSLPGTFPANARYDLFGLGDTYYASALACPTTRSDGSCIFAGGALNGSLTSPSNSPYAVGVGAVDVGADGTSPGTLEYFSSQGPTIDGRVKPDIAGWDGESSYVPEFDTGFYGTSAATPVVAGTAALVAQQNPTWDAAQIQNFLEQRASNGAPYNPPVTTVGHGLLTLGSTTTALPASYGFASLPRPTRILAGTTLGAGGTYTVSAPTSVVPADAKAVAVSLNVVDKTPATSTYLTAYPSGTAYPGVSNVTVARADPQVQTTAIVALGADGRFVIRNAAGTVAVYIDVLGYFGGATGTQGYTEVAGTRLLNTLNGTGAPAAKLTGGRYLTVSAGSAVPSNASGIVVNVMAFNEAGSGYLTVSPSGAPGTSTLVYNGHQRANLALVGLASDHTFRVALTGAAADVIVDLVGYLGPDGSRYVPLPAPVRIYNTQTGNGGHFGPLGPAETVTVQGTKVFDVPDSAIALVTGVQAAPISGGSYFTLYDTPARPSVSALAFSAGRLVSNLGVVNLGASGQSSLFNASGSVNAYLDLFGYFTS